MKYMDIYKVKNYKSFAEKLKEKTDCDVIIKIIEKEHVHYQIDKEGFPLGVLCVQDGEVSFAPFVNYDNAKDSQYINVMYMPMFEDFSRLLTTFSEMFVIEDD